VHTAITRSGGTTRIFFDGVEDARGTYTDVFEPRVLGSGNAGFLEGALDDVRIYDHALSEQQLIGLSAVPTNAPHAHWLLDDGSGALASDAVRGNDGMLVGGAAFTSGRLRGGVEFDGVNDWITLSPLEATDDFTLAGWVFLDGSGSASDALVGQAGAGTDVNFDGGRVHLFTDMGDAIISDGELPAGQWVHVADVRHDGALTIYIDAEPDPATGCFFGTFGFQALGTGNAGFLDGKLDDVRFYDRALRYAEIRLLVRQLSTGEKGHGHGHGHHKGKGKGHHKKKGKGHHHGPMQCADPRNKGHGHGRHG
jgi:hypothetical protein